MNLFAASCDLTITCPADDPLDMPSLTAGSTLKQKPSPVVYDRAET